MTGSGRSPTVTFFGPWKIAARTPTHLPHRGAAPRRTPRHCQGGSTTPCASHRPEPVEVAVHGGAAAGPGPCELIDLDLLCQVRPSIQSDGAGHGTPARAEPRGPRELGATLFAVPQPLVPGLWNFRRGTDVGVS